MFRLSVDICSEINVYVQDVELTAPQYGSLSDVNVLAFSCNIQNPIEDGVPVFCEITVHCCGLEHTRSARVCTIFAENMQHRLLFATTTTARKDNFFFSFNYGRIFAELRHV